MTDHPNFPLPDMDFAPLAPLWEAARVKEFRLPRCTTCGRFDWYPGVACAKCGASTIVWTRLSGRASLFSYATVHRALHKPLTPLGSYVSAIVTIEEDEQVRFVTRLIEVDTVTLRIGLPLEVRFEDAGFPIFETGVIVPLFAPRTR
jgi:uncharacterized OB-fold protein